MKHLYIVILIIFSILINPLSAQKKKKDKKKKEKVEKTVVEKRNLTFTKPKNAWQVGVFGGASTLVSDVTPNFFYGNNPALPGHNFGLFVSKSWSYLISTRLRYSTSVMFATDAVPSTLTRNQYSSVNRSNGIGFENKYAIGETIFHNSRTQGHDINFDLVFTLGNINYHRERSPIVFRVFPSIGMFMYQTFYDHLDENGNPYDYASLANLNDLGVSDRTEILTALSEMRDGKYETRAEEHSVFDEDKLLGYSPRVTFGLGAGFAVRLTKFLSLDVESRQMFTNDDLIDGMQWQEPGSNDGESRNRTLGLDSYNQTTLGLTYSFVTKKVGEPLCMQNPLWGSDAYDSKSKKKSAQEEEKVDSTNILLNEKVENLEGQIDNLEFLIKMLAQKKEEAEKVEEEVNTDNLEESNINDHNNPNETNPSEIDENISELTEEQERLRRESEALKGEDGKLNDVDDPEYRLRNGEYIYIADLQGEISAAYYLISGSFRIKSNAKNDQREWTNKGVKTYLMTDVRSGLYRIVVDYTNDHATALDLLDEYQAKLLKTIWLIKAK